MDEEKCIGCGTCAIVCPYNAPKVDEEKKRRFAATGAPRRGRGREAGVRRGLPGSCAGLRRCRGDGEDGRARQHRSLPDPSETTPNIFIKASADAQPVGAAEIANPLEVA
ncbi:MAG: 4Fe-4S binding protein [Eggerthellaceae bacterium]